MSEYILILTMIFSANGGVAGGIESIDVDGLESCHRIGESWIANIKKARWTRDRELKYLCVKRRG